MFSKRLFGAVLLAGMGFAFAATPFCDTRSAVRYFAVDSVVEYPYRGKLASTIQPLAIKKHSGLETITALSKGQDMDFLANFSTSCYWTEQDAEFKVYGATKTTPSWTSRDSSVWVNYIDNMTVGTATEWIYFREDTVGWKKATIYSNSYLIAKPVVSQWYAYATRMDTLASQSSTQILTRNITSVATDSAGAVFELLKDWAADEPRTDHKYDYMVQVFRVLYSVQEPPTSVMLAESIKTPFTLTRNGLSLEIQVHQDTHTTKARLLNLRGQSLRTIALEGGKTSITLPGYGAYILQMEGYPNRLVP